jgi:hypothetical protein
MKGVSSERNHVCALFSILFCCYVYAYETIKIKQILLCAHYFSYQINVPFAFMWHPWTQQNETCY